METGGRSPPPLNAQMCGLFYSVLACQLLGRVPLQGHGKPGGRDRLVGCSSEHRAPQTYFNMLIYIAFCGGDVGRSSNP